MDAERIDELIAGRALAALSPEEERELDELLRRSPEARAELALLEETAAQLAFGVEAPAPPAGLRERILAAAEPAEPENVAPLRRRWAVPALAVAAAAAAAVAIGLGVWASQLSGDLSDERAASALQADALAVAAQPGSTTYPVDGAEGTLVVAPGGEAAMVLADLAPAPEGSTYQAWVIADGAPVSAGVFDGTGGETAFPLAEPVPAGAVVAVTVERDGGAAQPTREPFLVVPT